VVEVGDGGVGVHLLHEPLPLGGQAVRKHARPLPAVAAEVCIAGTLVALSRQSMIPGDVYWDEGVVGVSLLMEVVALVAFVGGHGPLLVDELELLIAAHAFQVGPILVAVAQPLVFIGRRLLHDHWGDSLVALLIDLHEELVPAGLQVEELGEELLVGQVQLLGVQLQDPLLLGVVLDLYSRGDHVWIPLAPGACDVIGLVEGAQTALVLEVSSELVHLLHAVVHDGAHSRGEVRLLVLLLLQLLQTLHNLQKGSRPTTLIHTHPNLRKLLAPLVGLQSALLFTLTLSELATLEFLLLYQLLIGQDIILAGSLLFSIIGEDFFEVGDFLVGYGREDFEGEVLEEFLEEFIVVLLLLPGGEASVN